MIKSIIFDMDGVLFDTEKLSARAWRELSKEMNLPDMERTIHLGMGRNRNDTILLLKELYGANFDGDLFLKKGWDKMQRMIKEEGLPVIDGVREMLEWLQRNHYKIGIASSSISETVKNNLESTGLSGYFSVIIGGERVKHSKPKPDIYLMACDKIGERPENVIAVEDSPNGLKAAKAAGMKVVMIPNMISGEGLEMYYDFLFHSMNEMKAYMETI